MTLIPRSCHTMSGMRRLTCLALITTVNREYFDVKIFSDSMACAKIKRMKYMCNINDNAVQGRLSENYLMRKIIA